MRLLPLLLLPLLLPSPSLASSYEALCGDTPCTISLDANGLSSPAGFLPTGRIAQWFTGGQESYNAGSGTAGALGGATAGAIGGALLLGPIGLLGGLIGGGIAGSKAGKSADLFFNVVGYDTSGRKTTVSFRFVNPRPANQLKLELPMFTGLAMGQTRSLDELRAALASGHASPGAAAALPERLEPQTPQQRAARTGVTIPSTAGTTARPEPSDPATARSTTPLPEQLEASPTVTSAASPEQAWQDYLQQRNLVQWARSNPQLAEQLRQRLFPQP